MAPNQRRRPAEHGNSQQEASIDYISTCVKYTMFFINFMIWIVGLLMVAIGLWAFLDKYNTQGIVKVQTAFDIILDLSIVLIVVGGLIFAISFAGCIGALRENTCLLGLYSVTVVIILLSEITLAIVAFVFPNVFLEEIKLKLSEEVIEKYRDDTNLQNLIDFLQKEFQCCGISDRGYQDWNQNMYFNCSDTNESAEKCGVPYSCCRNSSNIVDGLINMMCGYGTQTKEYHQATKVIYTDGCITVMMNSARHNFHIIAGVALGVAFAQIFVLYLARSLQGQIDMQKARWR